VSELPAGFSPSKYNVHELSRTCHQTRGFPLIALDRTPEFYPPR